MYVSNPEIKDSMKKYVTYSLSGKAISGLKLSRRFSDFYALRKKLLERWPGVYIPNIPPKKAVGNLDDEVIKMRTRILNSFCYKLSQIPYLFESEEVKVFQSNSPDVSKALEKIPSLKYEEILEKYKAAFPEYYDAYDLILGKGKLNEFQETVKKTLSQLKTFKEACSSTINKKGEEFDDYCKLMKSFEEYEKSTLMELTGNDENKMVFFNPKNQELTNKKMKIKEKLINPYVVIYEWIEEEEVELEGIQEAINSFNSLVESREKLSQKSDSISKEIKDVQHGTGTKTMLAMIGIGSKETRLSDLEEQKKKVEKDNEVIHSIIRLACFNMECYLEYFKADKLKEYYNHLKAFSILHKNNNLILKNLWESVANDENMKEYKAV